MTQNGSDFDNVSRFGRFSQVIEMVTVYLSESLETLPIPFLMAWSAALSISSNDPVAIPSELIAVFAPDFGPSALKHEFIAVPIG